MGKLDDALVEKLLQTAAAPIISTTLFFTGEMK